MWLVSVQRDYYPDVMVFKNEQDAIDKYNQECSDINDKFEPEKAVFISEVEDFQKSDNYDLCDENTKEEIEVN